MKLKIHTAWCHYAATGEGVTIFAYITWATDAQHMREKVKEDVHEFWSLVSEVQEGIVRNDVTRVLWPEELLNTLERLVGDRAVIRAHNEVHFNLS